VDQPARLRLAAVGSAAWPGRGQVALDIEYLAPVYLDAYVPILPSSGQVVAFMTQHLGLPIPAPALFDKSGSGSAPR
jgi:hypothetical protein